MRRRLAAWSKHIAPNCSNIAAVQGIEAIVADMRDAQMVLESLEKRLNERASLLRENTPNEEMFKEVVSYVYWSFPEVSSVALMKAMRGFPSTQVFRRYILPAGSGIRCLKCGQELVFTSREALHNAIQQMEQIEEDGRWEEWRLLCKKCEAKHFTEGREQYAARVAEWKALRHAEVAADQKRLVELKSMNYRDYLRTPEWQNRRIQHLRSAGFSCQVCNARNTELHVHHRDYRRIGEELYQDLIVLCRDCHALFHENGKLFSS
jgi:5-methylcytosine-specific restriction endonuclease McrA